MNAPMGRFLSADSVMPNATGTQGYNPYAYAAGNPVRWADPSGHGLLSDVGIGVIYAKSLWFSCMQVIECADTVQLDLKWMEAGVILTGAGGPFGWLASLGGTVITTFGLIAYAFDTDPQDVNGEYTTYGGGGGGAQWIPVSR